MVDPQAGEAWGSTHPPHSLRDERRYKRPRRGGLVRIWFKPLVQLTQRLLGALQRSETIDHVRAAMGTAMNQLTGLANDAAKQHKKQRREQGSYQAKGRAAGAATAAAQQQRGARANERRGKNFQSKRRPHGHVQNTAHKRDTHSKLSGISKGKRKGYRVSYSMRCFRPSVFSAYDTSF